ncbi:MAG: polyphosphate polymerase domain-containing protein [Clostridiales bacterium]|nr:polyphosphate polymerase domain-containing protein [Clostridiales bacterium]
MNGQQWRHELKYLINLPEWALLRSRLPAGVRRDDHAGPDGEYMIRSLYFDDYWNTAYEEKEEGVLKRHKYRIRVYNCSDSRILLERKNKYGPYIWKQSAPLTRKQLEAILQGDYSVLLTGESNLLKEFYYECMSRVMRPRVIVDYDREPFVLDAGNVRITFDKRVRAGFGEFSLFDPALPTAEVLRGDQIIMEVKYTEFLPKLVRSLLPPRSAELTAASKYVLCCDAAVREFSYNRTEGLQWRH